MQDLIFTAVLAVFFEVGRWLVRACDRLTSSSTCHPPTSPTPPGGEGVCPRTGRPGTAAVLPGGEPDDPSGVSPPECGEPRGRGDACLDGVPFHRVPLGHHGTPAGLRERQPVQRAPDPGHPPARPGSLHPHRLRRGRRPARRRDAGFTARAPALRGESGLEWVACSTGLQGDAKEMGVAQWVYRNGKTAQGHHEIAFPRSPDPAGDHHRGHQQPAGGGGRAPGGNPAGPAAGPPGFRPDDPGPGEPAGQRRQVLRARFPHPGGGAHRRRPTGTGGGGRGTGPPRPPPSRSSARGTWKWTFRTGGSGWGGTRSP